MAQLVTSALRQRIAAALVTATFTELPTASTLGGRSGSTGLHKGFTVAMVSSARSPTVHPRGRTGTNLRVADRIEVTLWARLTAADQIVAYDAALDLEDTARVAVLGCSGVNLTMTYNTSARLPRTEGWVVTVLSFDATREA